MPWAARPRREPGPQEVGVMLKETLGRGDGPGEPDPKAGPADKAASAPDAEPAAETAGQAGAPQQPTTFRGRLTGLPQLIRANRLFSAALAVAILPRIIVMLGFQPAVLFKL